VTGAALAAAMERLCYDNTALARLLGVDRKTVFRWRADAHPIPAAQAAYIGRLLAWHDRHPAPAPPLGAVIRGGTP
jgi:hypothetical protein